MTIEQLVDDVVSDFREVMKDEEFETFEEMRRCYMWEPDDIRYEITYTANDILNREYDEYVDKYGRERAMYDYQSCIVLDDGSVEDRVSHKYFSYREFKKMVLSKLKGATL